MRKIGVRLLLAIGVLVVFMLITPDSEGSTAPETAVKAVHTQLPATPKPQQKPFRPETIAVMRQENDWPMIISGELDPSEGDSKPSIKPKFRFSKKRFVNG